MDEHNQISREQDGLARTPQNGISFCQRVILVCLLAVFSGAQSSYAQAVTTLNQQSTTQNNGEQNSTAGGKAADGEEEEVEYLLNGPDNPLKAWKFYSPDSNVALNQTFFISKNGDPENPVLVCLGKPFGYLRTIKNYSEYEFGFEWKFAKDPNGNSGVLIQMAGEDKIWPKAVQVQLHRPTAGSIFPIGGGKSANILKTKDTKINEKDWNTCTIISEKGNVAVTVNDIKLGGITGCDPSAGSIGLQSQGAEIHFRKIWIKKLKQKKDPAEVVIPIPKANGQPEKTVEKNIIPPTSYIPDSYIKKIIRHKVKQPNLPGLSPFCHCHREIVVLEANELHTMSRRDYRKEKSQLRKINAQQFKMPHANSYRTAVSYRPIGYRR